MATESTGSPKWERWGIQHRCGGTVFLLLEISGAVNGPRAGLAASATPTAPIRAPPPLILPMARK